MKIINYFKKNWIRFLVAFVFVLIFIVLNNVVNNSWQNLEEYSNGFFLGGLFNVLIGGLVLISSQGFFNIFSFYFRRKTLDEGRKENYTEYSERKAFQNKNYWKGSFAYFIVGFLFVLLSGLLLIF